VDEGFKLFKGNRLVVLYQNIYRHFILIIPECYSDDMIQIIPQ